MKSLESQKVIFEINYLINELEKHLKLNEDFEDTHKKVLQLCRVIFTRKIEYKSIDVAYPTESMVLKFDEAFYRKDGINENQVPSRDYLWGKKVDLGKKILSVLQEALEIFSLKLKLGKN